MRCLFFNLFCVENKHLVLIDYMDVEIEPEDSIIASCLAELRHDGSDEKRQSEHNENPASAGFLLSGDTTGVFATVHCTSTPVIAPLAVIGSLGGTCYHNNSSISCY